MEDPGASSPQEQVLGSLADVRLPYPAKRTMLSDSTYHEFASEGTSATVGAKASVESGGRRISVLWTITPGRDASPEELLSGPVDSDYVQYSTSFPLTSVEFRADGKLLVAGADRVSGRALVELWTFLPPTVSAASELTVDGLASRDVVFAAPADSDFGHVTWMLSGGALASREFLCMTYPSGTVYRLDGSTGIAAPSMGPTVRIGDVEPVPELKAWWDAVRYEGQHVKFGHCFRLGKSSVKLDPSDFAIEGVMLYDDDLDGSLDGALVLSDSDAFTRYGLTVAANWL